MRVFRFFENLLEPTALPPGPPPAGLGAFYWHHARQARGLVVALFAAGLVVALARHDDPGLCRPRGDDGVEPHPAFGIAQFVAAAPRYGPRAAGGAASGDAGART